MKRFILFMPIILIACTTPETPAQAVYVIESDYAIALKAENAYSSLPRCYEANSPKICSEISVIKNLQKSDDLAWIAIKNAQVAVRTNGFGDSKIATAVASAKALTSAFVEITSQLKVK